MLNIVIIIIIIILVNTFVLSHPVFLFSNWIRLTTLKSKKGWLQGFFSFSFSSFFFLFWLALFFFSLLFWGSPRGEGETRRCGAYCVATSEHG